MEEFYFNKEFKEQSDFDFDHYQYLFGLQARLDELEDPQLQQPVGIVKRPRSSRHKSGSSDASESLGTLLRVTFKPTDGANEDLDDDDAFAPPSTTLFNQPPLAQQPLQPRQHRQRYSSGADKPSGIPAPHLSQRRARSRDPSPLNRGYYDNGYSENGRDQANHYSQSHQMNRPKTTGQQQLRRPANYGVGRVAPGGAGSVDEDAFLEAFEQVPKINVYSSRDAIECINRIRDGVTGSSEDWEKRVEAMKLLRALLLAGGAEFEDFWPALRALAVPFRGCLMDLRSQVVREACITIAYLSSCLGNRLDLFAEPLLDPLLALLGNSAKVVATCGLVCSSMLLRHTQSHRLLPALLTLGQAKSSAQRRFAADLLADQVLDSWPAHTLERQLPGLQDWLRRCLADADQETRANARRAFWQFARQFWAQAASLLNACDARTRTAIERVRPSDLPAPAAPGASAAARAPQSTPASRGASPPRSRPGTAAASGPRSQASSRGSSPPRSGIPVPTNSSTPGPSSSFRRASGGSASARSSLRGGRQAPGLSAAAQSALAEALQFKLRQADGDDASETSSVCSDASYKSFTSCYTGRRFVARISKNLAEILAQLQSPEWSCRRDALASFCSYLAKDGGVGLNQHELRRVCDIFNKMFGEPNGRVMQFFLEALGDFVARYHGDLNDWLYTLLVKLISRMANESLTSQQARFQAALERVQRAFPVALQLRCLLRFLIDQNQQPSPKVQAALLQALLQVVRQLPPDALSPWRNQAEPGAGQEARIALSRLTTMTKEPKSADVRRLSQSVLAALFDLNPGCFSAVLKEMQPTIQQRATDVLRLQLGAKAGSNQQTPSGGPQNQRPTFASDAPTASAAVYSPTSNPSASAATVYSPTRSFATSAAADLSSDELQNCINQAAINLQSFNLSGFADTGRERPLPATALTPPTLR